jgi:ribosomal protection tetracycline resistance protein
VHRTTLNLGILAHVDAGKTTLTERLLHAAGVIDEVGSVDKGTTQTDFLALERQRGITIKSAVVSFEIDDVTVNLIDTPGHPDFIAEVERALAVLDGAVLVISAVEGVQPQTRVLLRALRRLGVPTLIFVNKIDRAGADAERVLHEIAGRLTPAVVAMGSVRAIGTREADFASSGDRDADFGARLASVVAENDDSLLAALVDDDGSVPYATLRSELAAQTARALVHPVFYGSALTGAGVDALRSGIAELLPADAGEADGPVSGAVFKIDRGAHGERAAYVRMFSGTVHVRDRLLYGDGVAGKVTAIGVFAGGSVEQRAEVRAREIAKLSGLAEIRIGDRVGETGMAAAHEFPPPTLESLVVARRRDDGAALRVALGQLAEQDPLIDVRQDGATGEVSVSLYGEVQKEVIQATLADDFGLEVEFRETTTICVERPVGPGEAVELLKDDANPFSATVALRVEPAEIGSGVAVRLDVDSRDLPLYIYGTAERFRDVMAGHVRRTLHEGLFGWDVPDCAVTLTGCDYYVGDGTAKPTMPTTKTTAADFRKLTPIVLMQALQRAGTVVCEPVLRVTLEVPAAAIGGVLAALARVDAAEPSPSVEGQRATVEAVVPAARMSELQRQLAGLTSGEGVLESDFDGYRPVVGLPPERRRTTASPLDRVEYLAELSGHRTHTADAEDAD